jgi:Short C-terminal domain
MQAVADTRLERLERLKRLHDSGTIDDAEFSVEKKRILA